MFFVDQENFASTKKSKNLSSHKEVMKELSNAFAKTQLTNMEM